MLQRSSRACQQRGGNLPCPWALEFRVPLKGTIIPLRDLYGLRVKSLGFKL